MSRLVREIDSYSTAAKQLLIVGFGGTAFAIDGITGAHYSMLLLYALVTAFAGWYLNQSTAFATAVASSAAAAIVRIAHPTADQSIGTVSINATLRVVSLGLLAVIVVRQRRLIRQLETDAATDPLTNIANRAGLLARLDDEIRRTRYTNQPMCIAYIDLDGLKECNDVHGHGAGDALIVRFVSIAQRELRSTDTIGRIGGDEFVIVLPYTTASDASRLARRLVSADGAPKMSIGVVAYDTAPADASSVLQRADDAMYMAKHSDTGSVVVVGAHPETDWPESK